MKPLQSPVAVRESCSPAADISPTSCRAGKPKSTSEAGPQSSLLPFPEVRSGTHRQSGVDHEARRRILRSSGADLADADLLALLLCGMPRIEASDLAEEALAEAGGIAGLLRLHGNDLDLAGLGPARRSAILAAVELGRRLARARMPRRAPLSQPDRVAAYLTLRYSCDQEVMGALYLDVRNRLIGEEEIYRGTLCRASAEPRGILKHGLLHGANGFVLFHTHPSGDPEPSGEDLAFTRRLAEAADLLGLRLLDHLILGGSGRWVSLKRRGAW